MPIREQQTTNKQHAIPQSIMSVEFKIIGDLTLRQFFFLLIFCGLAYTSFMLVQAFVFKWLLVVFFVGLGLCFAFLPLGDRGLDVWLINFLKAMLLPNQFVYRKDEKIPGVFLYQNLDVLRSELITLTPTSSRRKIEAYLEQQETPFDKLDYDEKSYILKVKDAYGSGYTGFSSASVTATAAAAKNDLIANQLKSGRDGAAPTTPAQVQILTELELPAPNAWQSQPVLSTATKQPEQEEAVKLQIRSQASSTRYQQQAQNDNYYSPTMTPDMHIGRRFINLSGDGTSREEIVLPIRGERVLKNSGSEQFDRNETERESLKVQQLDSLINQIRDKQVVQKQLIESQKLSETEELKRRKLEEETQKARQQAVIRIEEEDKRIREQAKLEAEKHLTDEEKRLADEKAREQIVKEQERLQRLRDQEQLLKHQKEELLKKQQQEELDRQKALDSKSEPQAIPLKAAPVEDSPTMVNVIWGLVVTNYQGRKVPVPGVVVVIRNQRREVVRAVKTNIQGKFGITTPLINGAYTVEIDKERKSGLTFDVTVFEAKGEPIPTIEVVGKV
jgi:hypothetical protein